MRIGLVFVILSISTPVFAQGTTSGASSQINITNPASSTTRLITTPTVVAPGLAAAGIETCLGSSAGGISVMGGGVTFGSTKVDDGCTIRLLARQLFAFGFQKAAIALMCQDERVAVAMDAASSPCPRSLVQITGSLPATEDRGEVRTAVKPYTREEQAWFDRTPN
jgi:hypothetical protein